MTKLGHEPARAPMRRTSIPSSITSSITSSFTSSVLALGLAVMAPLALGACSDDGGKQEPDAGVDAPVAAKCFEGTPTNHEQLINACVGAGVEKIDKRPVLPLLRSDGTLPPLP